MFAQKIQAEPGKAKVGEERFICCVQVSWLPYILRRLDYLSLSLVISYLGLREIEEIATRLKEEYMRRSWVDDIDSKYVAAFLQFVFEKAPDFMAFGNMKVALQHRAWAKKEFAAKLLHIGQKRRKLFNECKSFSEYRQQVRKLNSIKYSKLKDKMVYVPLFDIYLPPGDPALKQVAEYKRVVFEHRALYGFTRGYENREALSIRRSILRRAGVLFESD